jgi:maltose O-acetyltransferase
MKMLEQLKNIRRTLLGRIRLLSLKLRCKNLSVGKKFFCGKGVVISSKNSIRIGDNFYMGSYCHLAANAVIGNNVIFASRVALVGGDHKIDYINQPIRFAGRDELKQILIEDNVWVGHNAIIMHGVKIKTGAVIAAGAVVTKDVEENAIVGGNPAKEIRKRLFK